MSGHWFASQILDDGRWGVVVGNKIVIGVGAGLTCERADQIVAVGNAFDELNPADQSLFSDAIKRLEGRP